MTPNELVGWCEFHGVDPEAAQICVVVSGGAIPQIVERESLTADQDGDVVIST